MPSIDCVIRQVIVNRTRGCHGGPPLQEPFNRWINRSKNLRAIRNAWYSPAIRREETERGPWPLVFPIASQLSSLFAVLFLDSKVQPVAWSIRVWHRAMRATRMHLSRSESREFPSG